MPTTRHELHKIIDELSEEDVHAVGAFAAFPRVRLEAARRPPIPPDSVEELRRATGAVRIVVPDKGSRWLADPGNGELKPVDPLLQAFYSAPIDDEPLTDEDIAAIEEAKADSDAIPWETYLAERRAAG